MCSERGAGELVVLLGECYVARTLSPGHGLVGLFLCLLRSCEQVPS